MRDVHSPLQGSEKCVALLQRWIDHINEEGKIGWVAVVTAEFPNIMGIDYAGILQLEGVGREGIAALLKNLDDNKANRTLPERDPSLGADYVCYPLCTAPIGWDFLVWGIDAVMTMRREGLPGPLKVAFWAGHNGTTMQHDREGMFHNVLRPLLPLLGAVEDQKALLGRHKPVYVLGEVSHAVRALGEPIPILQASEMAREMVENWFHVKQSFARRPITITLRECEHWPHRNSNLDAWHRFAEYLRKQGERVVIVRDTAKAKEPFHGFECCPAASINVDVRMALYEAAKCNMLISNGPCGLCLFSNVPYLYFLEISEDDPHICNRPGFWPSSNGVPDGGQLPWAKPHQRFVWKRDTYENLIEAWEEFRPILKDAA